MGQFYKSRFNQGDNMHVEDEDDVPMNMEDAEARGKTAEGDSERINEKSKTTDSEDAGPGDTPVGGADAPAGSDVPAGDGGVSDTGGSTGTGGGASQGGGSGN